VRPVGSKYLLEEPMGRGATGTVWRARQNQTAGAEAAVPGQPGETVAIKVLKEELANDPDVVMRFLRERSVLLRLQHHNIVRTRDLVVEGDLLALVMDLVDGPDLHRYLRENGPFTPVAAALVTAQVADALAASHADGIVHRDLKPANVLLADGPDGMRPMLTDFGIARLADSPGLTRTQEFVGTPSYVAPESVEGRPQTSAVDIYGAGILLYELTTGSTPFGSGTALEVIHRHLREQPARPPSMPDPLWSVVERCLRKRPEERPGAESLARALRTVASGIGAGATAEQATAAMGVAGMLAPDPAPATVPDSPSPAGAVGPSDPTQALPNSPANAPTQAAGQQPAPGQGGGGYDPNAATAFMGSQAAPGQGTGQGQGQGPGQGGPNADPTQVMPPVPGAPPQPAQPPGPGAGPEDPHPWQNQLRAARDRNEQTQVQPLAPNLDPLRRRPTRQQSPQRQAPPPAPHRQAAPPPEQYGHGRPQRRPAQPPPRRYEEPPRRREPEPRRRREPEPRQRSANPMHIPGLGCLKGCLFMIVLLVVAAVLIWNLTPLPEWWEQGKDFWDSVTKTFDEISSLVDSAPQDPRQGQ
jgi:serine/threonine-protein kinase